MRDARSQSFGLVGFDCLLPFAHSQKDSSVIEIFTRRQTLVAAGALGASLAIRGANIAQEKANENTAWDRLKVKLANPALVDTRTRTDDVGANLSLRAAEGTFSEAKERSGRAFATYYKTTCDPSAQFNVLKVNGQDLRIADWVSFGFGDIEWKAGEGWPIYRVPDPKHDYNIGMKWNAYVHAILIGCLHDNNSVTYTVPFAQTGVYHLGAGRVVAFVNDGPHDYGDNRGYFDVQVYGWT